LAKHEHVRQVGVVAREDTPGDKRLVAYLVADKDSQPPVADLRSLLHESLPDYMIPSAFVYLDEFPLTPNGKVNRRALPKPQIIPAERETEYVAPRSEQEKVLADIWSELLDVETVGINDNFFNLGGHSLLATQLVTRIRSAMGVNVPLRRIFEEPTIAGLADFILKNRDGQTEKPDDRIERIDRSTKFEPSLNIDTLSDEDVDSLLKDLMTQH